MKLKLPRISKLLAAVMLSVLLLTTACAKQAPGRFDQVQQESSQQKRGQAVAKVATQGSEFNKFFPSDVAGYNRVFTQEKKGFAEAKLKQSGKDVAVMAISDTKGVAGGANPGAKFVNSTKQVGGYPAVEIGKTQTAVLVNNRYQVKVISRDPSFTASAREAWIKKFDLKGLARLS